MYYLLEFTILPSVTLEKKIQLSARTYIKTHKQLKTGERTFGKPWQGITWTSTEWKKTKQRKMEVGCWWRWEEARQSCFPWELCRCSSEHRKQHCLAKESTGWLSPCNFSLPETSSGQSSAFGVDPPQDCLLTLAVESYEELQSPWADFETCQSHQLPPVFCWVCRCSACHKGRKMCSHQNRHAPQHSKGCECALSSVQPRSVLDVNRHVLDLHSFFLQALQISLNVVVCSWSSL